MQAGTGAQPPGEACPVVLVAQYLPIFELVLPVWRELRRRGVPVVVVVTPYPSDDPSAEAPFLDADAAVLWKQLVGMGIDPLPMVPADQEAERIRSLDPCAVFLSGPYDAQRHAGLAAESLGLPIHYVNYFFRVVPDDPQVHPAASSNPFYRHCAAIYCETSYDVEMFLGAGVDESALVMSGHPGLDAYDEPQELEERPTVLWCPWHVEVWPSGRRGYATFVDGRAAMLAEARRRPHIDFVFRPHPLLLTHMRLFQWWTPEEESQFWGEFDSIPNLSYHDADVVTHVPQLSSAWAMVTDGIAFFPAFAYTGKPLLLTKAPGNPGWNSVGLAIEELVATSTFMDGLPDFLDEVEQGVDPAEVERRHQQMRVVLGRPEQSSASVVADHLVSVRRVALAALPSADQDSAGVLRGWARLFSGRRRTRSDA